MPDLSGGSAANQNAVQNAIQRVQARIQTEITDIELRRCIQKQTRSDNKIFIDDDGCYTARLGYNERWRIGPLLVKSDDIHICVHNHNLRGLPPAELENTLIHEWAHSCCWEHGDGKGVPL